MDIAVSSLPNYQRWDYIWLIAGIQPKDKTGLSIYYADRTKTWWLKHPVSALLRSVLNVRRCRTVPFAAGEFQWAGCVTVQICLNCYTRLQNFFQNLMRVLEKFKYPMYNLLRSNQKTYACLMISLRISVVIYSYQLSSIAVEDSYFLSGWLSM